MHGGRKRLPTACRRCQLAGGLDSALRTVAYQDVHCQDKYGGSKLRPWRIATVESGSKLPHSKLPP